MQFGATVPGGCNSRNRLDQPWPSALRLQWSIVIPLQISSQDIVTNKVLHVFNICLFLPCFSVFLFCFSFIFFKCSFVHLACQIPITQLCYQEHLKFSVWLFPKKFWVRNMSRRKDKKGLCVSKVSYRLFKCAFILK